MMIYLCLPSGNMSGWQVCGKHLNEELPKLGLCAIIPNACRNEEVTLPGPMLNAVANVAHQSGTKLRGTFNLGYTFFEVDGLARRHIGVAKQWDWIATGCSWCTRILKDAGMSRCSTIIQGVDRTDFSPNGPIPQEDQDKFKVFSGGCFQARKGHDIVIAAMKVMMDRHKDVQLVAAWGNPYGVDQGKRTMCGSPVIDYNMEGLVEACASNGLDIERTALMPLIPNRKMAALYRSTDIGLFPNRCEGGTNLVMMEYMSCRRPVIATHATGHLDILTRKNSIPVEYWEKEWHDQDGEVVAHWAEANVDSVIEALEWAYQNRPRLDPIAEQGAHDMRKFTWRRAAEQFYDLLTNGQPVAAIT